MLRFLLPAMLATVSPAQAQYMNCIAPREPYCVSGYGAFGDWEFESCRNDVQDYQRQVRAYLQCLQDEADETLKRANRVIDQFNTRARTP